MPDHNHNAGVDQHGVVAVVGATCPLGKHLVDTLLQHKIPVLGLFRRYETVPLHWWHNPEFQGKQFDLNAPETLARLLKTSSRIVWLVHSYVTNSQGRDPNLPALQAVLQHSATRHRKIVLLSSGGSVYGEPERLPVSESHICLPLSPYGQSKKNMEQALLEHIRKNPNTTGVILRSANIYGQYYLQGNAKGCVAAFTHAILQNRLIPLVAHGSSLRDFIHAEDVVFAILAALDHSCSTTWNVGCGIGTRTHEVLTMLCHILRHVPSGYNHMKAAATDVCEIFLDITKIKAECGWWPAILLREGLEYTLSSVTRPGVALPARDFHHITARRPQKLLVMP